MSKINPEMKGERVDIHSLCSLHVSEGGYKCCSRPNLCFESLF